MVEILKKLKLLYILSATGFCANKLDSLGMLAYDYMKKKKCDVTSEGSKLL